MASTAFSAQGLVVNIGTATGSAKTITAITAANPAVVTSTAHGFLNGDVVALAAIGGMTQLNGVSAVVQYKTANTFALANIDSTAYTTYTSGGTATPVTWTAIKNSRGQLTYDDGSSVEIDVTNFASTAKEFIFGLQDSGSAKFEVDIDNSDAGQAALTAAKVASSLKTFKITLPSGTTPNATFTAYVKQFARSAGVDNVVKGSIDLRISGAVTYA